MSKQSEFCYVIFTHEPRGITSRTVSRHSALYPALEEARSKSRLSYVEKVTIRQLLHDGKHGPVLGQFVKGKHYP
jgi:hypothetical protein